VDRKHGLSLRPILHEIGLLQEPICLLAKCAEVEEAKEVEEIKERA
jgi:hypothetical protein